ncbi:hypothetical protein ACJMK2_015702, partial [Sinanodonta woodiana]
WMDIGTLGLTGQPALQHAVVDSVIGQDNASTPLQFPTVGLAAEIHQKQRPVTITFVLWMDIGTLGLTGQSALLHAVVGSVIGQENASTLLHIHTAGLAAEMHQKQRSATITFALWMDIGILGLTGQPAQLHAVVDSIIGQGNASTLPSFPTVGLAGEIHRKQRSATITFVLWMDIGTLGPTGQSAQLHAVVDSIIGQENVSTLPSFPTVGLAAEIHQKQRYATITFVLWMDIGTLGLTGQSAQLHAVVDIIIGQENVSTLPSFPTVGLAEEIHQKQRYATITFVLWMDIGTLGLTGQSAQLHAVVDSVIVQENVSTLPSFPTVGLAAEIHQKRRSATITVVLWMDIGTLGLTGQSAQLHVVVDSIIGQENASIRPSIHTVPLAAEIHLTLRSAIVTSVPWMDIGTLGLTGQPAQLHAVVDSIIGQGNASTLPSFPTVGLAAEIRQKRKSATTIIVL